MTRIKFFVITTITFILISVTPAVSAPNHSGTVLATVTGGGYSYLMIDEGGSTFWIAAPQGRFTIGSQVSFAEQLWMKTFKSKALQVTFDKILFVSSVQSSATHKTATIRKDNKMAHTAPAKTAEKYSINEIYEKKDTLKGHLVKVRGKVTKVSTGIMGRNWVHIKDGTGSGESAKIIFTSKWESATVGTDVIATGTLKTDQDFGFGYFYPVIVEDSSFKK